MPVDLCRGHWLVCAERYQYVECGDAGGKGCVDAAKQQRQWYGASSVRYDEQHPSPIDSDRIQPFVHGSSNLIITEETGCIAGSIDFFRQIDGVVCPFGAGMVVPV